MKTLRKIGVGLFALLFFGWIGLVVYAYWPWGNHTPKFRKAGLPRKPAILVSSSAAPGLLGRWMFGTRGQLKTTAATIGAKPVGTLFIGMIAGKRDQSLSDSMRTAARKLTSKLLQN